MSELANKVVDYLIQLDLPFEEIAQNMWVIHDEFDNIDNIVLSIEEPLLIFRLKLMEIPKEKKEEFFKKLLSLNANSLVHGAYAIENDTVIIVDTLEIENLDLNELQASIESIIMSASQDYKVLSGYITKE